MKKIISLILALMLVLCMGVAAFADEGETPSYKDQSTKTFTKVYTVKGTGAENPAETFSFSAVSFVNATDTGVGYTDEWAKANLPTIDSVSYGKGESGKKTFTITLPENYPSVGVYNYSFTEVDNGTAGVTYRSAAIRLVVTVIEDGTQKRIAAVHCEESGDKTGSFDNTYSAGQLAVVKKVEGNLGDKNKDFEITVTFTAPEGKTVKSDITYNDGEAHTLSVDGGWTGSQSVKIMVKDGETVTFNNLPDGVTYTIEETDSAAKANGETKAEYEVEYDVNKSGTIVGEQKTETTVTNTKGAQIDIGVSTDSLPYVVLLGVVAVIGAAMLIKRRATND